MANKRALSLKQTVTNGDDFRLRAIAEYHELLAADETLTAVVFKKLRGAMRKKRLLYGDRPIGIALRPHLLRSETIPRTDSLGRTRYECIGKSCGSSCARSKPNESTRPDRGGTQNGTG